MKLEELGASCVIKGEVNQVLIDQETGWVTFVYSGKLVSEYNLKTEEITQIRYISKENMQEIRIGFKHEQILEEHFRRSNINDN